MPTKIGDIADLLRILEEQPEWVNALRPIILGQDLLELPREFRLHQEENRRQFAQLQEQFRQLNERTSRLEDGQDRLEANQERLEANQERLASQQSETLRRCRCTDGLRFRRRDRL